MVFIIPATFKNLRNIPKPKTGLVNSYEGPLL